MVFNSVLKLHAFFSISLLLLDHSHGTQLVIGSYNIILIYNAFQCAGIFELVPSGQVYVCTGPQKRLEVVCSSSESSFLEWNLTFPASNNRYFTRSISNTNVVGYVSPFTVGNVMFEFAITKNPLTSRASANLISPVLNGSVIICREPYNTAIGSSAALVLHVVDATTAGLSV